MNIRCERAWMWSIWSLASAHYQHQISLFEEIDNLFAKLLFCQISSWRWWSIRKLLRLCKRVMEGKEKIRLLRILFRNSEHQVSSKLAPKSAGYAVRNQSSSPATQISISRRLTAQLAPTPCTSLKCLLQLSFLANPFPPDTRACLHVASKQ